MTSPHRWTFFRAGGFDQVKLESGADLLNIEHLDQKLWAALSCPIYGLNLDPRTLEYIDTDNNKRVRASELIAALQFAGRNLKNPDDLLKGDAVLPLSAIVDDKQEGKVLIAAAKKILGHVGKPDATSLSIDDIADTSHIFQDTAFNGDGIITALSASTEEERLWISEIIACLGSEADLSGKPGVSASAIAAFLAEVKAYQEWIAKVEPQKEAVWPIGEEATAEAVEAVNAIAAKIEDYFGRCRLAAFDSRSIPLLNRKEEEYAGIAAGALSLSVKEVADFPLAQIAAGKPLPLTVGINPAHDAAVKTLLRKAVLPLLGERTALSEADWMSLKEKLAPFYAWHAQRAGQKVEKLGHARLMAMDTAAVGLALTALMEKDKALAADAANIEAVQKLVRYYRDLALLCNNFVNFSDFYDGEEPAIFQYGTLFLDQRACHLCLRVEDVAKHSTMAALAGAYLAYCECSRKGDGEKLLIVAAFTSGDSDNLMLGRNGVFYDRQGRDWDATIVKIIDNPISIRQAFWAPYKKFVRYLEEQVNKRAAAAEAENHATLSDTATAAVNADKTKAPAPPKKMDVGTVAAIGVAFGAIGTFLTALVGYATGIFKLGFLPTTLAFVGLILLISTPSVVMAYMKLRKRNLGPILDGNGWAVNAKAKINVPFGATLSSQARLPKGARRDLTERYADRGLPWKRWVFLLVLLYGAYGWFTGKFNRVLPEQAQAKTILGKWAPAPKP